MQHSRVLLPPSRGGEFGLGRLGGPGPGLIGCGPHGLHGRSPRFRSLRMHPIQLHLLSGFRPGPSCRGRHVVRAVPLVGRGTRSCPPYRPCQAVRPDALAPHGRVPPEAAPDPVAFATGAGGALRGPATGASLARPPGLIALHAGQSPPGLASLTRPSTGSDFFRPSGVPMPPGSTELSSDSTRSRSRERGKKHGRSGHRSSSSSDSSARSRTGKKCRDHDSVSRAEFLQAVQSITASVSAMSAYHPGGVPCQLGPARPPLVRHFRVSILTRAGRLDHIWAHLTRSAVRPPLLLR